MINKPCINISIHSKWQMAILLLKSTQAAAFNYLSRHSYCRLWAMEMIVALNNPIILFTPISMTYHSWLLIELSAYGQPGFDWYLYCMVDICWGIGFRLSHSIEFWYKSVEFKCHLMHRCNNKGTILILTTQKVSHTWLLLASDEMFFMSGRMQ